jgi:cytochrome c biogenesis protein
MSQLTRKARMQPFAADMTDVDGGVTLAPWEALEWLWRIFTSMRTALVLILGLAFLGLIGAILVQAPAGLSSDPQSYAAWLISLKPKYVGWTDIIDRLGLFSVFQSIWFRAIIVGLTTSILACSVNRFRGLWKTAVHPRIRMTDRFFDTAPLQATVASEADRATTVATIRQVLGAHHYRTVVESHGEADYLYVDRFRWARFGSLVAHLSLVLILVGALVGSLLGYRNGDFAATVGTRVDVGGGTGLSLEATSFSDSYYANGEPSDYASSLVLYRGDTQVAAKTIRVNDPLDYDGVTFYQSFFGPAAIMQVADASGATVYDAGVPLLWASDDGTRRIGQFTIASSGLTVFVVGAASGQIDPSIKAGEMQLEIYPAGAQDPSAVQVISQGTPTTIGDLQYTFEREQQFTGLIVSRDPGALLVWLGALALVAGLFLIFMFPNRRMWLVLRRLPAGGHQVRLAATGRTDATFAPEFGRLVDQVRVAFGQAG